MLMHGVYFTLQDRSEKARKEFVGLCEAYLQDHDGTIYFAVGERGEEFRREVNDQEFDVALYVAFESAAAHDKYQEHPRHQAFIEQAKSRWAKVRVFDSYLAASSK